MTIQNTFIGSSLTNIEYKNLPDTYAQVEYIQNNIPGYIDTGVIVTSSTKVEADFQFIETRFGADAAVFGVREQDNLSLRCYVSRNSFADTTEGNIYSQTSDIHDRTTVIATPYGSGTSTQNTIYLFGLNQLYDNSNYLDNYFSVLRLYSLQIYENDILIKDYVPAIRKSDGIYGLYEIVDRNFLTMTIIPSDYQLVECLESTGIQYINTEYTPNSSTRFFGKFKFISEGSIFGTCNNDLTQAYYIDLDSIYHINCNFKINSTLYNPEINNSETYNIHTYSPLSTYSWDNSNNYYSITSETLDPYGNFYLFAINKNSTPYELGNYKISYIIFTGNLSVTRTSHYYIAVIRKSDDKPGFYDLITNTFLTNVGSGEFNYGNNIQPFQGGNLVFDHIAKKVKKIYFGDSNGKAKNITSAYIGDNNEIARCVYTKRILPLEFQQTEWIRNDNNTYINLKITPKKNSTKVSALVKFIDVTASGNPHIFGCQNSNNANRFKLYTASSKLGYGFVSTARTLSKTISNDMKALVTLDAVNLSVNIVVKSGGSGSSSTTFGNGTLADRYIYVFAQNNAGTVENIGNFYIYSLKVWEGAELKRDLYPCIYLSNNKVGMYDIIEGIFYPSWDTSKNFVAGPAIIQEL